MIGSNAQRAALDALRRLDNQLISELDELGKVREQASRFRGALFEALGWIEEQCFQLKVLQIKTKREETGLMRVEIKERLPIVLFLDPEPAMAFDGGQGQELVGRLFVTLAPPVPGLLRQYTIAASGAWRRATFARSRTGEVGVKTVAAPNFSGEMLLLEAVDLLNYVSTLRFGWPDYATRAASLGLDELRDRARNRDTAVS
jgi:hypothetical protein